MYSILMAPCKKEEESRGGHTILFVPIAFCSHTYECWRSETQAHAKSINIIGVFQNSSFVNSDLRILTV